MWLQKLQLNTLLAIFYHRYNQLLPNKSCDVRSTIPQSKSIMKLAQFFTGTAYVGGRPCSLQGETLRGKREQPLHIKKITIERTILNLLPNV